MAVTKIHRINSTLNLAIDYITNRGKTEEGRIVSSFACVSEIASRQFARTRQDVYTDGKALAHHLIQSFLVKWMQKRQMRLASNLRNSFLAINMNMYLPPMSITDISTITLFLTRLVLLLIAIMNPIRRHITTSEIYLMNYVKRTTYMSFHQALIAVRATMNTPKQSKGEAIRLSSKKRLTTS